MKNKNSFFKRNSRNQILKSNIYESKILDLRHESNSRSRSKTQFYEISTAS